jgi:hypothetical protein
VAKEPDRKACKRRISILVACAVLAGTAFIAWRTWFQPTPERAAQEFTAQFRNGEWGKIFRSSTKAERALQGWDEGAFVSVMSEIEDARLGSVQTIEFLGDWQGLETKKVFTFNVTLENGEACQFSMRFYRDFDKWRPAVANLPLLLHNGGQRTTRESAQFLYDVSVRAGIRQFVRLDDRIVFSVDRLGQYLDGTLEWSDVIRPAE